MYIQFLSCSIEKRTSDVDQHNTTVAHEAGYRCNLLALARTLKQPIKGCECADVSVRLLEGLGLANSKSDWLEQHFDRHLFYATGPAEMIVKAHGQISLTLATNDGWHVIG